jgi:hypothetical protein
MECISIECHPETSICILYTAVKATRSTLKSDWLGGTKSCTPTKEIKLSWYQSIDKKYFWVYIKFDGGLSIPFARKMRPKKLRLFPKGCGLSFLQMAGFKILKTYRYWSPNFFQKSCTFLRTEIMTHRQILQALQCAAFLSTDTRKHAFQWCVSAWTLQEAPKSDWLEWYI